MKNKIKFIIAFISIIMISNGCRKDKEGPMGPQGTAGTNGNANVIGTISISTNSNNWTPISTWGFSTEFNLGTITQSVIDKGVVMVYEQSGSSWIALPYTYGILSRAFTFSLGEIKIYVQNTDLSTATNPGVVTYRFVVISPSNRMAHSSINYENYEQVKKEFNLKD